MSIHSIDCSIEEEPSREAAALALALDSYCQGAEVIPPVILDALAWVAAGWIFTIETAAYAEATAYFQRRLDRHLALLRAAASEGRTETSST